MILIDEKTDVVGTVVPDLYDKVLPQHPCINESVHDKIPRLHLPVAPNCNIKCNYCERNICPSNVHQIYPGLSSSVLTPYEAQEKTKEYLSQWGESAIIGISGPGDPLANEETFTTLNLIAKDYPSANLCLCTNGLELPERIGELNEIGLKYISVTLNGVDPSLTSPIYSFVQKNGTIYRGHEAAAFLLENQLLGIKRARDLGIYVKINSVVIPGINDIHMKDISRMAGSLGCVIHNITPLIPRGKFNNILAPSNQKMKNIRVSCSEYINVFSKCKQCRADAAGIPGLEKCCEKN